MHCNWPLLNVQLMINEAWLFTFCHWTHGCDINIVKNYLERPDETMPSNGLITLSYSGTSVASPWVFRWFKFTLKPPYRIMHEHLLSAIWDTSHWNFFLKFGLKTTWDISYDILWQLLKYVNFWWLQSCLSTFAKIGCLQKINFFLNEGVTTHRSGLGS